MGRVTTNATPMRFSLEDSPGVLAGTPLWKAMERENLTAFGTSLNKVRRTPVSLSRRQKKGTATSVESTIGFDTDLTMDSHIDFLSAFLYSTTVYPYDQPPVRSGALFDNLDVTSGAFTHDALSAAIPAGTIIVASGFSDQNSNGTFIVDSGGTTTSTPVTGTLGVDETPTNTANATIEIAGVRGANPDFGISVSGSTVTITSATFDFTTANLTVGQSIHVGGVATANQFATAANFGFARIVSIGANALVITRTGQTFVTEAAPAAQIDILFGPYTRDVDIEDALYREQPFQFELVSPNLGAGGATRYEYSIGNLPNEMTINSPSQGKMTVAYGFIGQDTEFPVAVGSRKTNADQARQPVLTDAINTGPDQARLRIDLIDGTGLTTDFVSWSLAIQNNVEGEPVQGQLGPKYFNTGDLAVNFTAQAIFSEEAVVEAIRCQQDATADLIVRNGQGAIVYDLPSIELGGGNRDFPRNRSVLINFENNSFEDPTLNIAIGVTRLPLVPPDDDC